MDRSVKLSTQAQIRPRWRSGELCGSRSGGSAGALETSGPTRRRRWRANSVLGELRALDCRPLRPPAPEYAQLDLDHIRWHREAGLSGVFRM